jgi:hypothetical protein
MSAFTLQTLSAMTLSDAQTQLFSGQVSMHQQLIIRSGVRRRWCSSSRGMPKIPLIRLGIFSSIRVIDHA